MAEVGFDSEKIIRYYNDEYNEKDTSYIDEIFCDDKKAKDLKRLLYRQFYELKPEGGENDKNLDHILHKIYFDISTRLSEQNKWSFVKISKWALRIAVAIMLPLVIYIGIQTYKESYLKKEAWVVINAPAWTRVQFSLPDGTTGWLNSRSSLKYNGSFIYDRKVILTGEAFFDVFKDKKKPFIVNTNEVNVTVLGTRFNVASYNNEDNIEVVLEEGKLVFNDKEMNKPYTMKPNDLVIYDKISGNYSTEVVQPCKYSSWKDGKLIFRNDPLDVIARRLERWYDIDVEVKVDLTEDLRLRATFIDEDIEEVLDLLKRSLPINYRIERRDLMPDGTFAKKKVIITTRN